jgi:hypothetical protein
VSRRVRLPAADELFRTTDPLRGAECGTGPAARDRLRAVPDVEAGVARHVRKEASGERRSTGRERHHDKITVYVSAEELLDLEQARLTLRGQYELAVDRGRLVREAVAYVLEDFEGLGEQSALVRRLRRS